MVIAEVDITDGGSHMIPGRGEMIQARQTNNQYPGSSTTDSPLMARSAADMAELVLRG